MAELTGANPDADAGADEAEVAEAEPAGCEPEAADDGAASADVALAAPADVALAISGCGDEDPAACRGNSAVAVACSTSAVRGAASFMSVVRSSVDSVGDLNDCCCVCC